MTPASKWNVNRNLRNFLSRYFVDRIAWAIFHKENESNDVWMVILINFFVVWRDSELRFQYKSICDDGVISKK